jgi:hypothetical protein
MSRTPGAAEQPSSSPISVPDRERQQLLALLEDPHAPTHYSKAASVILLAADGRGQDEISKRLKEPSTWVEAICRRWSATDGTGPDTQNIINRLSAFEGKKKPKALKNWLLQFINLKGKYELIEYWPLYQRTFLPVTKSEQPELASFVFGKGRRRRSERLILFGQEPWRSVLFDIRDRNFLVTQQCCRAGRDNHSDMDHT